jgi:hypothetical protein
MPIVFTSPTFSTTTANTATTTIDTAAILEHAFRRCRVQPSQQTPELVQTAKESLYIALQNLVNRGLNLWCLQTDFIGLSNGQSVYDAPVGTVDITNVIYSQPIRVVGSDIVGADSYMTVFNSATSVVRLGLKFDSIRPSEMIIFQSSNDGIEWENTKSYTRGDWTPGVWYWYPVNVITATHFRIVATSDIAVREFYLASSVSDLPVVQWNRDTWATIPNKMQVGRPSTNYYLERLLTPRITLWPVPNNSYDHLQVFVQRQINDVDVLTQPIEVPQRWVEAIIWQLASRLCFELPQVDAALIPSIVAMADKMLLEVEREEVDGAPIALQPSISVYTR